MSKLLVSDRAKKRIKNAGVSIMNETFDTLKNDQTPKVQALLGNSDIRQTMDSAFTMGVKWALYCLENAVVINNDKDIKVDIRDKSDKK